MSLALQLLSRACAGPAVGRNKPTDRHANSSFRPLVLLAVLAIAGCLASALPARAQTIELRPATGNDDAEERADLSMYTGSSDLELVFDGNNQTIGIRWAGLAIPPGATITTAWVQFTAKESQSEVTNLLFTGQAADNPVAFSGTAGNISSRPRTAASVAWSPAAWTSGQVTAAQRTPELKAVIQEIVGRGGWASGNALVLVITGTGHRTATAYNGGATAAPLLHVEYTTGPPPPDSPPTAVLNVSQAASPALTVNASAAGSTDPNNNLASYTFSWGDGTANTTVNHPTQTASHTYAATGTYTVTLTARDTGNLTSAPVTRSITVAAAPPANSAPTANLTVTQSASPARTVSASAAGTTDPNNNLASYTFSWGDGTSNTTVNHPTQTASHTYAAAGTYTVTLTARDAGNLTSVPVTRSISVNAAPTAVLNVSQAASPARTVDASAAGSTDSDAFPIASYTFAWGDGTPNTTVNDPTQTASHTYAAGGTYTVTLTAKDTGNLTSAAVTKSISVNAAPVAALSASALAPPAVRTVSASAANSTDNDPFPIASYTFAWGDGTPNTTVQQPTQTTIHSYAVSGTYTVTLTATDTGNLTSAAVTQSVTVTDPPPVVFDALPGGDSDDAEQSANGSVSTSGSDIEMVFDANSNQIVGFRWPNLGIYPGATIQAAWVQFTADESQSEVTNLTLQAQAADNAATFTSSNSNISSRPRTAASVLWSNIPAWSTGQKLAAQRTPDLKALIQEVVNRPGWVTGNAIALIVTGTGHRTAEAAQGSSSAWATLHVEFTGGTPPPNQAPVAALTVTQAASPALTATASAAGSVDNDPYKIVSYRFTWGDGTSATVVNAPTQTANHTYAAAGTYTVTVTATDAGGLTSAPVTKSITVSAGGSSGGLPIAVWCGYYSTHHSYNPQPKPNPWMGSSNVVFVGTPDSPSGGWDTSALKIDNLSSSSITMTVTVDIGSKRFALWGSRTVPAGQSIIFAQTGFENFDGSDLNPAGCYDCNANLCLTAVQSTVPVANITINGVTTKFYDRDQTMNTDGVDYAGCPKTSGRNDESRNWVRIYASTPGEEQPSATNSFEGNPNTQVLGLMWLSPAFPNPATSDVTLQFNLGQHGPVEMAIYDVAGRLVRTELTREFEPGQYQKIIPIRGLAAGMYYCTLRTNEGTLKQAFTVTR